MPRPKLDSTQYTLSPATKKYKNAERVFSQVILVRPWHRHRNWTRHGMSLARILLNYHRLHHLNWPNNFYKEYL